MRHSTGCEFVFAQSVKLVSPLSEERFLKPTHPRQCHGRLDDIIEDVVQSWRIRNAGVSNLTAGGKSASLQDCI